jgi:transcriptional regulator with XRE-family HTH domain
MPKVYLNETEKLNSKLTAWVYGELKVNGISQRELAEELGISQQLLSYRLKNKLISFSDFACFVRVFNADQEEIARLLGK